MTTKLRVILADDHPVVLLGARSMIEAGNAVQIVAEANSVDELLTVLDTIPCDVLVTDFSMPGGNQADGQTLINLLRRRYPNLPIVLMTMMNNAPALRQVFASGVLGIVEKGASIAELPLAIQAVAKGRRYISSSLREKVELTTSAPTLSPKETEVIRLLASGLSVTQAAQQLSRSVATVSRQKNNAMQKLGIGSDSALYAYAREAGFS